MYSQLIILSIIFIESSFGGGGDGCPPQLSGCECGIRPYGTSGRPTYVTNCTNQQFNQSAEQYMRHVPIETEVLLMVGNLFPQLSRNLLNQSERYDKLYMVDLSRNGIETIHGQAFHNMRSVQILHLDHNNLSISDQHSKQTIHPRIFSPLKSLEELHLRNTFSKTRYLNNSIELINSLTDLFHSTNLSLTLKLLNLESNHLTSLGSEQFFCQLSSIQRIRLADNLLTTYPINSSCLRWLSSIDLSSNMIVSMDQHSIDLIGSSGMERIGSLHVDLSDNPFRCDCSLLPFFRYIRNITSATVDIRHVPKIEHVQRFRCSHQSTVSIDIKGKYFDDLSELDFDCTSATTTTTTSTSMTTTSKRTIAERTEAIRRFRHYITLSYIVLVLLLTLLAFLIGVLIYTNREYLINTWNYFLVELNTKNDYTALDARDSSNRTQIDKERNEWNEDDGQCSTKIEGNRFTDEVNVPDTPEVAEVQV